jgi:hypothetical protein
MAAPNAISTHNNNNAETDRISLRPYSLKELSALYGVTSKTLLKWLRPFEEMIGKRNGNYYSIPQVRIIFSYLEIPSMISDKI